MPDVADISHLFGNDVAQTPSGDLATVSGAQRTIQRVIRRLCTPQTVVGNSAYPWQPPYGCGLPLKIGDAQSLGDLQALRADIFTQLLQDDSVAPLPAPQVSATSLAGGGATIGIIYTDLTGLQQSFNFDLAP